MHFDRNPPFRTKWAENWISPRNLFLKKSEKLSGAFNNFWNFFPKENTTLKSQSPSSFLPLPSLIKTLKLLFDLRSTSPLSPVSCGALFPLHQVATSPLSSLPLLLYVASLCFIIYIHITYYFIQPKYNVEMFRWNFELAKTFSFCGANWNGVRNKITFVLGSFAEKTKLSCFGIWFWNYHVLEIRNKLESIFKFSLKYMMGLWILYKWKINFIQRFLFFFSKPMNFKFYDQTWPKVFIFFPSKGSKVTYRMEVMEPSYHLSFRINGMPFAEKPLGFSSLLLHHLLDYWLEVQTIAITSISN